MKHHRGSYATRPRNTSRSQRIRGFTVLALLGALTPVGTAAGQNGHDFVRQARQFYSIVACAPEATRPAFANTKAVDAHCEIVQKRIAQIRDRYLGKAIPFLQKHLPAGLPSTVVYPFGGGDLVSALVTYPQATEITTISLEHAGDPRRLPTLTGEKDQRAALELFRKTSLGLLSLHDSTSKNLALMDRGPIPGQLSFHILALAIHDYEPVSLRYFEISRDGTLRYLTSEEFAALEDKTARKKNPKWNNTDFSVAYSNMELHFRKRGDPTAPVRIHRHVAANLANHIFQKSPLRAYLKARGRVAAMTKAASYLLWTPGFSMIRDYLLSNMDFMISDSTGVPPLFARKAGFEQISFGRYEGAFLNAAESHNQAFLTLYKSQPFRSLPFRYGYPDNAKNWHLLITRPRQATNRQPPMSPTGQSDKKSP